MSIYIPNEAVISDFIRENVEDPNSSRTYLETMKSYTAGASQSEFNITAPSGSVSHITEVKVDGNVKTKWKDFAWDYKGEKIIFYSDKSPNDGDTVEVTFKYSSTNWVYIDLPIKKIREDAFPRVRVYKATQSGGRLGNFKAPVESSIRFQIDVWAKEKVAHTVSGIGNDRNYSGEDLAQIIIRKISKELEDNIDDIYPVFYDYNLVNDVYQGFDSEYQAHHYIYEFTLKTTCNGIFN